MTQNRIGLYPIPVGQKCASDFVSLAGALRESANHVRAIAGGGRSGGASAEGCHRHTIYKVGNADRMDARTTFWAGVPALRGARGTDDQPTGKPDPTHASDPRGGFPVAGQGADLRQARALGAVTMRRPQRAIFGQRARDRNISLIDVRHPGQTFSTWERTLEVCWPCTAHLSFTGQIET